MKLLHSEVELVPGRPGALPQGASAVEGPLPGSIVVRLENTTTQENAVDIRLRCDEAYWQESWYSLIGLTPPDSGQNGATAKADQPGRQGQTLRVFLPRGATRDILIRFRVPRSPLARAGAYRLHVEVEQHVTDSAAGPRREGRVSRLPVTAIIQPFHQWSLEIHRSRVVTGLFWRSGAITGHLINEGNDWLYCTMRGASSENAVVLPPTDRIAVPPAEPGDLLDSTRAEPRFGTRREMAIPVHTRLFSLKGAPIVDPIHVTAIRLEAPSVLPLTDAVDDTTVLGARETDEIVSPAVAPVIVYRPLIPEGAAALAKQGLAMVQSLSQVAIAAVALILVAIIGWEHLENRDLSVRPVTPTAQPGGNLRVTGSRLDKDRVDFFLAEDPVPAKFVEAGVYDLTVPKALAGTDVALGVQRKFPRLQLVNPLLPAYQAKEPVTVAALPVPPEAAAPGQGETGDSGATAGGKSGDPAAPGTPAAGTGGKEGTAAAGKSGTDTGSPAAPGKTEGDPKAGDGTEPPAGSEAKPPPYDVAMAARITGVLDEVYLRPYAERLDRQQKAAQLALSLTRLDPQNPFAWAALGFLQVDREALPDRPQSVTPPTGTADPALPPLSASELRNREEGRRSLERALELDPDCYLALTGLGIYYLNLGRRSDSTARTTALVRAAQSLGKATAAKPDYARAHYVSALLAFEANDLRTTKSTCTLVLSGLKQELAEVRMLRGRAFLAEAQSTSDDTQRTMLYKLALTDLQAAEKLDPTLPGLSKLLDQAKPNATPTKTPSG